VCHKVALKELPAILPLRNFLTKPAAQYFLKISAKAEKKLISIKKLNISGWILGRNSTVSMQGVAELRTRRKCGIYPKRHPRETIF